jgi:hypothetical protein
MVHYVILNAITRSVPDSKIDRTLDVQVRVCDLLSTPSTFRRNKIFWRGVTQNAKPAENRLVLGGLMYCSHCEVWTLLRVPGFDPHIQSGTAVRGDCKIVPAFACCLFTQVAYNFDCLRSQVH